MFWLCRCLLWTGFTVFTQSRNWYIPTIQLFTDCVILIDNNSSSSDDDNEILLIVSSDLSDLEAHQKKWVNLKVLYNAVQKFFEQWISDSLILNKISWKFRCYHICGFADKHFQSLLFWNKSEHRKEVSIDFLFVNKPFRAK